MKASAAWKWVGAIVLAGSSVICGQPKDNGQELPAPKKSETLYTKSEPPAPPTPAPAIPGLGVSETNAPLLLEEVISSVEQYYPLLAAVQREREVAGGRLLSAMGVFDTNLRMTTNNIPLGTYEGYRSNVGIDQAFMNSGATVFSGYRTGLGDFPIYNGGMKTADGGEFRAGVLVPLLQNREIDRRRASFMQAQIDRELVEPVIQRSRLDFYRAASRTYWSWVASGQRVDIAKRLLKLAADRDIQLAERVKAGAAVEIVDRVDNQQNMALRGTLLVQAEQSFQQASIELSLFLRDRNGEPIIAPAGRLPRFPTLLPVDAKQFDLALATAYDNRPELRRQLQQYERLSIERRLAENQTLPILNAYLAGSQDIGYTKLKSGPDRLDAQNLDMGLELMVPIQRREALGRVAAVNGQMLQLTDQIRFMRESIRAEVQATWTALERTYNTWEQASARVGLAQRVAAAERERFRLGRSDILTVTLRETAAFDAELAELAAKFEYFRTLADYRAALGIDAKGGEQ